MSKKCPRGTHFDDIHGCIPNRMKLLPFLNEFDVEPTEISYQLEMSWYDYDREHSRYKDKGKLYDKWFYENKNLIKETIAELARRDYKVEII
jgi:hypothetical protein